MGNPNNWAWGSIGSRNRALQAAKASHQVIGVAGAIPPSTAGPFLYVLSGAGASRAMRVYKVDGTLLHGPTTMANSICVMVAAENPLAAIVFQNGSPATLWYTLDGGATWASGTFAHPLLGGGASGDRQYGVTLTPNGKYAFLLTTGYSGGGATFGCATGADRIDRLDLTAGVYTQGWISDAAGGILTYPPLNGGAWASQMLQGLSADNTYLYVHRTNALDTTPANYCGGNPGGGKTYNVVNGVTGPSFSDMGQIAKANESGASSGALVMANRNAQGFVCYAGSSSLGLANDTPILQCTAGTLTTGVPNDVYDSVGIPVLSPKGKIAFSYYRGSGLNKVWKVSRSLDAGASWATRQTGISSDLPVSVFGYPFDPETYYCEWYSNAVEGRLAGDFVRRQWSDGSLVDVLFNLASSAAVGYAYAGTCHGAPSMPL